MWNGTPLEALPFILVARGWLPHPYWSMLHHPEYKALIGSFTPRLYMVASSLLVNIASSYKQGSDWFFLRIFLNLNQYCIISISFTIAQSVSNIASSWNWGSDSWTLRIPLHLSILHHHYRLHHYCLHPYCAIDLICCIILEASLISKYFP